MQSKVKIGVMALLPITMLPLLTACDPTNQIKRTNPNYYDEICDRVEPENSPRIDATHYADGTIENDIAQARGHLSNVRKHYERFDCEKEHTNRRYDYSLLGVAIAASAAALSKANAYVLGGVGLTAAGIAATKSYSHPDTDRDAYLDAYRQLTCAYDATQILKYNINIETLKVDRAALDKATAAVKGDLARYPIDEGKQTSADKSAVKAAQAALDAGNKALSQIETTFSDYKKLPGTIYSATDSIDVAARSATRTNGTYASFNSALKNAYSAAGENKVNADDFRKSLAAAQGAAAAVEASPQAGTKGKASSQQKKILFETNNVMSLSGVDFASPCAPGSNDLTCSFIKLSGGRAVNSASKIEIPASMTLADTTSSDVAKLNELSALAAGDLPSPSYADVIASVIACAPKQ